LKDKERIPAISTTFLLRMVMELKYYAEVIGHHHTERQSVKFLMFYPHLAQKEEASIDVTTILPKNNKNAKMLWTCLTKGSKLHQLESSALGLGVVSCK